MKKLIIGLLLAVLVLAPVGCTVTSEVFFPTQRDGLSQMEALLEGELDLDDEGWLRAASASSSHVLIWPYGFTVRGEGKEIQVLNGDGDVIAVVGEAIEVEGGEATIEIVEQYTGNVFPDGLAGPYWIVSEVMGD